MNIFDINNMLKFYCPVKTIRSLISCLFVDLILFSSCSDNNPCNDDSPSKETPYYLDAVNKTNIPYRQDGKDTLVYISDAGDTATLYGIGAKTYFGREWVRREPNPDCGAGDYNLLETLEYTFEGSKTKPLNSISFKAYLWRINAGSTYKQLAAFTFNGNIKTTQQNLPLGGIPDDLLFGINDTNQYTTKISLNGIAFSGISIYNNQNTDTLLIYNKAYGILRVKLNGQLWNIKS